MKLKNIEEFREKMQERGWDADAYLAEVDRKIAEQGYYNEDFTMHPEDNHGFWDDFEIFQKGTWDEGEEVTQPIYVFGTR